MIARVLLGALGVVLVAVGVRNLVSQPTTDLANALLWLAGGVVVHDVLLAPLTVALLFVGTRFLPGRFRAPAAGALLVLGTVTLTAVPVLLSLGAKEDNPTLLDRNYVAGWLVLAALVVVGALLVAWRSSPVERKDG
jgi:hypothetical protein